MQWIKRGTLVLAAATLGLFVFFRYFFLSGGKWIMGGMADGRLILGLHEHWYRFLTSREGWFQLNFFYPETNVLGYSDTFLLGGLLHSLFRFSGLDPFLAFQFSQMTMAVAGFTGMAIWLCRYRKTGFTPALFGAVLLLAASPIYFSTRNTHIQLQAVWLIPWVAILMEQSWLDHRANPKRLLFSFTALCGLYGLIAYSTYYIAWFSLLFMVIWILCAVLLVGWREVWKPILSILKVWKYLLPGAVVAAAALLLFLRTYLPTRLELGGRSLGSAIKSLPLPWDFLNHSETNLLWGKINSLLHPYHPHLYWELELGPTLLFTIVLIATAIALLRQRSTDKAFANTVHRVTALAVLVSFVILLRISMVSLWAGPYFLVPGGDGIRACLRFMVLLMVPAICLLVLGLRELRGRVGGSLGGGLVILLGGLILLEQIQLVPNGRIDRREQLQTLAQLPPPPADATAFVPVTTNTHPYAIDVMQAGAILYSQHWNLPVMGGRSGFTPEKWGLYVPTHPSVYYRIIEWCEYKSIKGVIYPFDMESHSWERAIRFPGPDDDLQGIDLTTLSPRNLEVFTTSGWSPPESWGMWSIGQQAEWSLSEIAAGANPMRLDIVFGAFVDALHPRQSIQVLIDGNPVFQGTLDMENKIQELSLTLPRGASRLTFLTPDAASPKELGISDDPRVLGVSLQKLVIHAP